MRDVLGQSVNEVPVVLLPAVVSMLLGLWMVSGFARKHDVAWLSTVGLAVFIAGLVLLALVAVWADTLGDALGLRPLDLWLVDLSPEALLAMLIAVPMGLAFAFVNVAAKAVLNRSVPLRLQGRIFALQMVIAGIAALPPLLLGGALTEIVDVRVVLGLMPVLLVVAWTWAHWGSPDPRAWRRLRRPRRAAA